MAFSKLSFVFHNIFNYESEFLKNVLEICKKFFVMLFECMEKYAEHNKFINLNDVYSNISEKSSKRTRKSLCKWVKASKYLNIYNVLYHDTHITKLTSKCTYIIQN